jgi:hypothetical protein
VVEGVALGVHVEVFERQGAVRLAHALDDLVGRLVAAEELLDLAEEAVGPGVGVDVLEQLVRSFGREAVGHLGHALVVGPAEEGRAAQVVGGLLHQPGEERAGGLVEALLDAEAVAAVVGEHRGT